MKYKPMLQSLLSATLLNRFTRISRTSFGLSFLNAPVLFGFFTASFVMVRSYQNTTGFVSVLIYILYNKNLIISLRFYQILWLSILSCELS